MADASVEDKPVVQEQTEEQTTAPAEEPSKTEETTEAKEATPAPASEEKKDETKDKEDEKTEESTTKKDEAEVAKETEESTNATAEDKKEDGETTEKSDDAAATTEVAADKDEAPAAVPSTPAPKKTASAARRKSTGNLKGAATPKKPSMTVEAGDLLLARLRGYPPWPAIVLDEELTQMTVLWASKPKAYGAPNVDERYRVYPVAYLPDLNTL